MRFHTSDPHYYHQKIIDFEKRPFKSINTMHMKLISNFNKRVKPEDETWFYGDVGFNKHMEVMRDIICSLNGTKHLVLGNHDKIFKPTTWLKIGFETVHINYFDEKNRFLFVHNPKTAKHTKIKDVRGVVHGHFHSRYPRVNLLNDLIHINVGVDVNNLFPVSEDELLATYNKAMEEKDSLNKLYYDDLIC